MIINEIYLILRVNKYLQLRSGFKYFFRGRPMIIIIAVKVTVYLFVSND